MRRKATSIPHLSRPSRQTPFTSILPSPQITCQKCGQVRPVLTLRVFDTTRQVVQICPCQEAEIKRQDEVRRREQHEKIWRDAVPPRFRMARLRDFDGIIQDQVRKGGSFLLAGPTGTGKTRLLAAILRMAHEAGESIAYVKAAELNARMDATYADDGVGSEWGVIRWASTVAMLGLDDIGAEKWSVKRQERVLSILDARIEAMRPFAITTNLSAEMLANHLGMRLFDRLRECRMIKMDGTSRRIGVSSKQEF